MHRNVVRHPRWCQSEVKTDTVRATGPHRVQRRGKALGTGIERALLKRSSDAFKLGLTGWERQAEEVARPDEIETKGMASRLQVGLILLFCLGSLGRIYQRTRATFLPSPSSTYHTKTPHICMHTTHMHINKTHITNTDTHRYHMHSPTYKDISHTHACHTHPPHTPITPRETY